MENLSNRFKLKGQHAICPNRICKVSLRAKDYLTCNYHTNNTGFCYSSAWCKWNTFFKVSSLLKQIFCINHFIQSSPSSVGKTIWQKALGWLREFAGGHKSWFDCWPTIAGTSFYHLCEMSWESTSQNSTLSIAIADSSLPVPMETPMFMESAVGVVPPSALPLPGFTCGMEDFSLQTCTHSILENVSGSV